MPRPNERVWVWNLSSVYYDQTVDLSNIVIIWLIIKSKVYLLGIINNPTKIKFSHYQLKKKINIKFVKQSQAFVASWGGETW